MHRLQQESSEFAYAIDAIETVQYVQKSALAMVYVWSALEALFSPSPTELTFRVSALMAAYLERPGAHRISLQKEIAKMYGKRSGAAHGKPKHEDDDVMRSMSLMQWVIDSMVNAGKVPSKAELESILFGNSTNDEVWKNAEYFREWPPRR